MYRHRERERETNGCNRFPLIILIWQLNFSPVIIWTGLMGLESHCDLLYRWCGQNMSHRGWRRLLLSFNQNKNKTLNAMHIFIRWINTNIVCLFDKSISLNGLNNLHILLSYSYVIDINSIHAIIHMRLYMKRQTFPFFAYRFFSIDNLHHSLTTKYNF